MHALLGALKKLVSPGERCLHPAHPLQLSPSSCELLLGARNRRGSARQLFELASRDAPRERRRRDVASRVGALGVQPSGSGTGFDLIARQIRRSRLGVPPRLFSLVCKLRKRASGQQRIERATRPSLPLAPGAPLTVGLLPLEERRSGRGRNGGRKTLLLRRLSQTLFGCLVASPRRLRGSLGMASRLELALELWPARGLLREAGPCRAYRAIFVYRIREVSEGAEPPVGQRRPQVRGGILSGALVLCVRGFPLPPPLSHTCYSFHLLGQRHQAGGL